MGLGNLILLYSKNTNFILLYNNSSGVSSGTTITLSDNFANYPMMCIRFVDTSINTTYPIVIPSYEYQDSVATNKRFYMWGSDYYMNFVSSSQSGKSINMTWTSSCKLSAIYGICRV